MRRTICSTLVFALGLAGLPVPAPAAPSGTPILIGAVLSVTGPFAPLGEPERDAVRLAERELNARGGIGGRPVVVDVVDDEGKPDTAAQLAQQEIGKGAVAIVGGTTSNTTGAIVRVTTAAGKLQIYPTPTSVFWNGKNGVAKTVFETTPRNELEAAFLLNVARTRLHAQKIAILHDENAVGSAGDTAMVAEMQKAGLQPVVDEAFPTAATDVTGQLTKIKASGADVLILWGASPALGLIARQIKQLDLKVTQLSSTGTLSDNFLRIAGAAGDGVYSDSALNFTHPAPETARFLTAYRGAYKKRAVQFAAFAYDAVMLVARALEATKGNADGTALAAALETGRPYAGATGTYRFSATDHNGLAESALHLAIDRNAVWFTL